MPWHDSISANLPAAAPEGSEPPALRADILDELADHLECAMARELRRTDDAAAARRAVLDRFGDPARIARKLWLDAMKEQLMDQRMMFATQLALVVAVGIMCVVVILMLRQNHQMQQALLARLQATPMAASRAAVDPATLASYDWPTLHVQVMSADGSKGVPDVSVELMGDVHDAGKYRQLTEKTDAQGKVSFGPIRAGGYRLRVVRREQGATYEREIAVPPGPDRPPVIVQLVELQHNPVAVKPVLDVPQDMPDEKWIAEILLLAKPASDDRAAAYWSWPYQRLLLNSDGRAVLLPGVPQVSRGSLEAAAFDSLPWRETVELDQALRYDVRLGLIWQRLVLSGAERYRPALSDARFDPPHIELSVTSNQEVHFSVDAPLASIMSRE
jgi:hypothetical protein